MYTNNLYQRPLRWSVAILAQTSILAQGNLVSAELRSFSSAMEGGFLTSYLVPKRKLKLELTGEFARTNTGGLCSGWCRRIREQVDAGTQEKTVATDEEFDKAKQTLLRMVGNAQYDVRRYPGHVAVVTDDSDDESRARLYMFMYQRIKKHRIIQYICGFFLVCGTTTGVMRFTRPQSCGPTLDLIRKITEQWPGHDPFASNIHEYETEHCAQVRGIWTFVLGLLPAHGAPIFGFVAALIMCVAMLIEIKIRETPTFTLYNKLVSVHIQSLQLFFEQVEPLLFHYIQNPRRHRLNSIKT